MKTVKKQHIIIIIILLIVLFFSPLKIFSQSWEPLGDPFVGTENARLGFQSSLSADGNHLAIGAYLDATQANEGGAVYTYQWDGNAWQPYGTPLYGQAEDRFGTRVALDEDGDTLIVSAPESNIAGKQRGYVQVYKLIANTWTPSGIFYGEFDNDRLGLKSVDVNLAGDIIAIGSWNHDTPTLTDAGRVQVFQLLDPLWVPMGQQIIGFQNQMYLGAVTLSGSGMRMVVGAIGYDENTIQDIGILYVLEYNGSLWEQIFSTTGDIELERFGLSIDLDEAGKTFVVSSSQHTQNVPGRVKVFKEVTPNNWQQIGNTIIGNIGEGFGYDVAINASGNAFVFSAPDFLNVNATGSVYSYQYNGSVYEPYLDPIVGSLGYSIGYGLSLNANGNRLVVGAPNADIIILNEGWVQVYEAPILGINAFQDERNVTISPNPFVDSFTVSMLEELIGAKMELVDATGKKINSNIPLNQITTNVNVELTSGIYFLNLKLDGKTMTKKIIKH
ncbi:MAG: T9SS type A sorting domain-containing protein [Flavobacteriaceae bacterium]